MIISVLICCPGDRLPQVSSCPSGQKPLQGRGPSPPSPTCTMKGCLWHPPPIASLASGWQPGQRAPSCPSPTCLPACLGRAVCTAGPTSGVGQVKCQKPQALLAALPDPCWAKAHAPGREGGPRRVRLAGQQHSRCAESGAGSQPWGVRVGERRPGGLVEAAASVARGGGGRMGTVGWSSTHPLDWLQGESLCGSSTPSPPVLL